MDLTFNSGVEWLRTSEVINVNVEAQGTCMYFAVN